MLKEKYGTLNDFTELAHMSEFRKDWKCQPIVVYPQVLFPDPFFKISPNNNNTTKRKPFLKTMKMWNQYFFYQVMSSTGTTASEAVHFLYEPHSPDFLT